MEKLAEQFKIGFRMRDEVKADVGSMWKGNETPLKGALGGAGLGALAGGALGAAKGHPIIGGALGTAAGAWGGHLLRKKKEATITKTANNPKIIAMNLLNKAKKLPVRPDILDPVKRLAQKGLFMTSASAAEVAGKLGKFGAVKVQKLPYISPGLIPDHLEYLIEHGNRGPGSRLIHLGKAGDISKHIKKIMSKRSLLKILKGLK